MDSLRIERLRCLSDTGYIQIKPITVLLGQNSSGKSTFLRVFPLLKQSVEARTTGPILWNGRLVDFGSYQDARQHDSDEGISLSFKFKLESNNFIYPYVQKYYGSVYAGQTKLLDDLTISMTLQISEDQEKGIAKTNRLILVLDDESKIDIEFGNDEYISRFQVNPLILNVREIENLIPTSILSELVSGDRKRQNALYLLEKIKTSSVSDTKAFLDLKKGLFLKDIVRIESDQVKSFWTTKIPQIHDLTNGIDSWCKDNWQCSNTKKCNCCISLGFGENLLDNTVSWLEYKTQHKIAEMVDQSLRLEWEQIGEAIVNWCFSEKPIRA